MFRLYSKSCEYAIRGLMEFYDGNGASAKTLGEVCRKARLPLPFTRKVFQSLIRKKLLQAVPGPGGGYRLIDKADDIPLIRIIEAVDGKEALDTCLMGRFACKLDDPCILHDTWVKAKDALLPGLRENTLGDLFRKKRNQSGKKKRKKKR